MPLANYFASSISKKMNKTYVGISKSMEASVQSYYWPGNIREMENVIEQSMILNEFQSELRLMHTLNDSIFFKYSTSNKENVNRIQKDTEKQHNIFKSFEALQRDYNLDVLNYTNWKVSGLNGAANLLKMKDLPLFAKMKRLGIEKKVGIKQ